MLASSITKTFGPALLVVLVGFLSLSASPTNNPQEKNPELTQRVSVDPDQLLSVDINPSKFVAKLETQLEQSNELVEEAISDLEVQQDKLKSQEAQLDQYAETLKFLRATGNTDRAVLAQVAEEPVAFGACTCRPKWDSIQARVSALEEKCYGPAGSTSPEPPVKKVTSVQKYCDPKTGKCYSVTSSREGLWYPGKILFKNRR